MSSKPPGRHFGKGGIYNLDFGTGFFFFTKTLDQMIDRLIAIPAISSIKIPNLSSVNILDFSSMAIELNGSANNRSDGTKPLKKYCRPEWQERSPIKDVFCRYGAYCS
jgi:hypothetical protein